MAAISPAGNPARTLVELLRREYEADGALLTDSGTSALTLAITAALNSNDPMGNTRAVALPAFGCFDIATAAIGANARVVLYDLDPDTLGPDLASLERALQAGATVAVAAPLYGIPIDWEPVASLAERHGVFLIEDAAQGHGALHRGRPLGSLGRLSVLSFGRGKGWTGAGGGALLWRDFNPGLEHLPPSRPSDSARSLVQAAAHLTLGRPALYGLPASLPWLHLGETRFRTPKPPRHASIASAAIALATFKSARTDAAVRHRQAATLQGLLDGAVTVPRLVDGSTAGFLRMPVRVDPRSARSVTEALARLGVAVTYPCTLASLPALAAHLGEGVGAMPGAQTLVRELITLPTHGLLSEADIAHLARRLRGLIDG